MNRGSRPALAGCARRRRRGRRPRRRRRPHESAHLHVAGAATYIDDMPELAGTLHARSACRRWRTAGCSAIDLDADRAPMPGVVAVLTAADIPGPNDCGPIIHDDPILAEGEVHYLGQPVFAVIATTRDAARRAAAQAKAALRIEPLPAAADAAGGACRAAATCCRRCTWRAATPRAAIAAAPHRLADTLDVGGQEQFYLEGQIRYAIPREDDGMLVHCSTQHPSEMQHLVAHALGLHSHQVQVECRRMGGGFGGKESQSALFACVAAIAASEAQPPGQAAPRPRRRLHDHRPAPLLLVRVRGRLRRRRPHPRRRADDGLARRLLGRPVGPGDDARDLPLRQRLLAARRRDARLLGQDQHAEQHRLPRLRRPAGRDRDREHPRLDRAQARQGSARRAPAQLLRRRRTASATSRPTARWSSDNVIHELVAELEATSDYRARREADRRVQRAAARCSSAASRSRR